MSQAALQPTLLNPSTALPGGALKTSRKGVGQFEMTVRGVSAHAGLDPGKGISAVEPKSGRIVWEYGDGASTIPSATPSDGILYVPSKGITALQMDIKISGLSTQMMKEALEQAKEARMHIMGKMLEVLDQPRAELKPHAPRIITVKIPVDKIGALIGPGGKNIRALQEDPWRARVEKYSVGQLVEGVITRLTKFGAFARLEGDIKSAESNLRLAELQVERMAFEATVEKGDHSVFVGKVVDASGAVLPGVTVTVTAVVSPSVGRMADRFGR